MTKFAFLPEKYWNISDERLSLLKKYLDSLDIESPEGLTVEEIINICIKGLKTFKLSEEEKDKFKNLILAQNEITLNFSIEKICKELSSLSLKECVFLSLGCGNESLFERRLDLAVKEKLHNLKINWLGLDIGDFRDDSSFFKENPFKVIEDDSFIEYRSFVEDKTIPIILVGRYSFHHIGIDYSDFLKHCKGITKVVLIEEPTTTELWNLSDYRFMRIAYDVLANTVFVLDWATAFIEKPSLFKINYIKKDVLPENTKIFDLKDVMPETSLVIS